MWAWRPPRCGPRDPPVCGPGDPPGVGLKTLQARPLNFPPGCGPENLQSMLGYHPLGWTPQLPPWVWAWRPPWARPLNFSLGGGLETCKVCWDTTPSLRPDPSTFPLGVDLETCKACWDTTPLLQGMLGYHLQCMLRYHPP